MKTIWVVLIGLLMTIYVALAEATETRIEASMFHFKANVGEAYDKGEYARAIALADSCLIYAKRNSYIDDIDPLVFTLVNNIAALFKQKIISPFDEPLAKSVLDIWEKALWPESPGFIVERHFSQTIGDEPFYQGIPTHWMQSSLEKEAPHNILSSVESIIGKLYEYVTSDNKTNIGIIQRIIDIERVAYGQMENEFLANSLNNLGMLYQTERNYTHAKSLFQDSISAYEKTVDSNDDRIIGPLKNLSILYQSMDKAVLAVPYQNRVNSIEDYHLKLILSTNSSEAGKQMAVESYNETLNLSVSMHLNGAQMDREAMRLAFVTLLQRKGLVLWAMTESFRAIREHLSEDDKSLFDKLMTVRTQWANLVNNRPKDLSLSDYSSKITNLKTEADNLEGILSSHSAEFRPQSTPVTLEAVQKALPIESALVELVSYKPFHSKALKEEEKWGSPHYAAYILHPQGSPQGIDLGETAVIDQHIASLLAALHNPHQIIVRANRGQVVDLESSSKDDATAARIALEEKVLRPIGKLLGNTRNIFFAPDGQIDLLPVAALTDQNNQYLLENYHFTYLSSGRDLLRLQESSPVTGQSMVLADPAFDETGRYTENSDSANRGRRSSDLNRGSLKFAPLPGTAQEANAIGSLLGITPISGQNATESALKQSQHPSILHLATHGFFLPDQTSGQTEEPSVQSWLGSGAELLRPPPRTENSLLRSGLALAGANQLQSGSDDGLLTALEASGLDLWGTQLVVLSACETGVGKVKIGEGVYGLRRALVIAGAETQVMSLWKVDDAATRDLMVDYYRRLKAGEGRSEALRQAQLTMLHSKDRSHPYYWAGFIVSGDWRKLKFP